MSERENGRIYEEMTPDVSGLKLQESKQHLKETQTLEERVAQNFQEHQEERLREVDELDSRIK